ncbi:NAD-dependent epimerase/dehydratase family protein [Ruminiclostridium josui]|uniref:NAD-dependent epimerase/dehydratase family protein n=1 Tax=Ruminiclostridium josui TaxID=1499 RepID=UPI000465D05B|nr:NAD-dependent epimerase/dehydratase family protein [Ruminiclostridium josui]
MYTLITGGTGFIGKRLIKKLSAEGRQIKCLVREKSDTSIIDFPDVKFVIGDVKDPVSVKLALEDVDVIYHLAARAHPSLIKPYKHYEEVNVLGTRNILDTAISSEGIKKIVLMSSIAATGPSRDGKLLNENSPLKPITNYGISKVEVEKIASEYHKKYSLPIVVIRPPMVYGIGDKDWVGFFKMIKEASVSGKSLPIPGSHENLFDFCFVDNLVEGLIGAEKSEKTIGQTYFLSDGRPYKISEILSEITKSLNTGYPKKFWPKWWTMTLSTILEGIGYVFRFDPPLARRDVKWMTSNYWVCDCTKAKKDFRYNPKISLEEGIRRTLDWAQKQGLV